MFILPALIMAMLFIGKTVWKQYLVTGQANAIAVYGSDVYVTGSSYGFQSQLGAYWKNGTIVSFVTSPAGTLATESGNAIVVVQH